MPDHPIKPPFTGPVKSGIPLPPKREGRMSRKSIYPFAMMSVGDMFETESPTIAMRAKTWAALHKLPWKFAVRYLGDGRSGLWRVK